MCLARPVKIKEISGLDALCETGGLTVKCRLDLIPDAKIGEYVIVHAGFAIEKVKRNQAEEVLDAFRELYEQEQYIEAL